MPCSAAVAAKCAGRLGQYQNWRFAEEPAKLAVLRALTMAAKDDRHALKLIDHWCRTQGDMPLESQIYKLAEELPAGDCDSAQPDHKCECGGTGFRQVWALIDYRYDQRTGRYGGKSSQRIGEADFHRLQARVDDLRQRVASGVEPCVCPYGQRLEQARLARAAVDDDAAAAGGRKARRR
jgi:hypothetical protein